MTFETYKGESNYDSSANRVNQKTAEMIDRVKAKKIGMTALDVFKI